MNFVTLQIDPGLLVDLESQPELCPPPRLAVRAATPGAPRGRPASPPSPSTGRLQSGGGWRQGRWPDWGRLGGRWRGDQD